MIDDGKFGDRAHYQEVYEELLSRRDRIESCRRFVALNLRGKNRTTAKSVLDEMMAKAQHTLSLFSARADRELPGWNVGAWWE